MNYQIVTGSTGTSISISFIEVYGNASPAAAPTRPTYRNFDNTPRRVIGRQNYNTFGGGHLDSWRCYKPGGLLADFSKFVVVDFNKFNLIKSFIEKLPPLPPLLLGLLLPLANVVEDSQYLSPYLSNRLFKY